MCAHEQIIEDSDTKLFNTCKILTHINDTEQTMELLDEFCISIDENTSIHKHLFKLSKLSPDVYSIKLNILENRFMIHHGATCNKCTKGLNCTLDKCQMRHNINEFVNIVDLLNSEKYCTLSYCQHNYTLENCELKHTRSTLERYDKLQKQCDIHSAYYEKIYPQFRNTILNTECVPLPKTLIEMVSEYCCTSPFDACKQLNEIRQLYNESNECYFCNKRMRVVFDVIMCVNGNTDQHPADWLIMIKTKTKYIIIAICDTCLQQHDIFTHDTTQCMADRFGKNLLDTEYIYLTTNLKNTDRNYCSICEYMHLCDIKPIIDIHKYMPKFKFVKITNDTKCMYMGDFCVCHDREYLEVPNKKHEDNLDDEEDDADDTDGTEDSEDLDDTDNDSINTD
jgi:hypothetical protein